MRIPSDIKVNVPPARSGVLEQLGLRTGQTITAEVTGTTASGATLLNVAGQSLALTLPFAAEEGQILQFLLQGTAKQPQLQLLNGKPGQAQVQQPTQGQTTQNPASSVTLSQSANAQTQQPANQTVQPQSTAPQPATAQAATAQATAPAPTTTQPAPQTAQPSPPIATRAGSYTSPQSAQPQTSQPTAPQPTTAAPQAQLQLPANLEAELSLQQGQLISGRVVQSGVDGQTRIAIGSQTLQAKLPAQLQPGTIVTFKVDTGGANKTLSIVSQTAPRPGAPSGPGLQAGSYQITSATTQSAQAPLAAQNFATPANLAAATVGQVAVQSIASQDSVGQLISSLTGLRHHLLDLPKPVADAARQLLGMQLDFDKARPGAEILQAAIAQSGLFREAQLGSQQPALTKDMKSMLMLLRNALGQWLKDPGTAKQQADGQRPGVPIRGNLPRAGQLMPNTPLPGQPEEAGRHLLQQTDSALSRLRLFQLSSLPDAARAHTSAAPQEWNLELPFIFGGERQVMQFQITRDEDDSTDAARRGWHMAFSMHFKTMGEVGAKVSLRGKKTAVLLWADNEETAEYLETLLPELNAGLTEAGLEAGAIRVRRAHPEDHPSAPVGGYVDDVT